MACATLKRSLDWDPLNSSPGTSGQSSNKSASSSHHHHQHHSSHRPSKRRCLFTHNQHVQRVPPKEPSPFGDVFPHFTADDIAMNIKEEMKRLQNRRQLFYSPNDGNNTTTNNQTEGFPLLDLNANTDSHAHSNIGLLPSNRRDQPLFTFRQVGLICERLIKERETLIREEYDQVLSSKLAEQYDMFVKFTYDQIQKRLDADNTPSYLS